MKKKNRGYEIEDLVEHICEHMFLKDFTVRSPKYIKGNKLVKEAADFIVPFDDYLLAFQIKSKTENKSAKDKSTTDFERIRKKIEKGIIQLNTLRRAINAKRLIELKNALGITIPFDWNSLKKIIGIIIIALIGEEKFEKEEHTKISNGFTYYKNEIPVHIFKLNEFEIIASEIDTLPDFIKYLNVREFFYSKHILSPVTYELDFLALYKTRTDIIEKCLKGDVNSLLIDDGLWKQYSKQIELIKKRNYLNFPSLVVDDIISWFHTSIGFDLYENHEDINSNVFLGTVDKYFDIISELAKFDRLERRMIGKKFLEKMKKADYTGIGYSFIKVSEKYGLIILSSNKSRKERIDFLGYLCSVAYCYYDLEKILGIATEQFSEKYRSYDATIMENVIFDNCRELADRFNELFGKTEKYHITEYGEEKETEK